MGENQNMLGHHAEFDQQSMSDLSESDLMELDEQQSV